MASLLDPHGLLGVVLRLAELAARTLLLGGVAFLAALLPPLRPQLPREEMAALRAAGRGLVLRAALATVLAKFLGTGLALAALASALEVPAAALLDAGFVQAAGFSVAAVLALAALALPRGAPGPVRRLALLLGVLALLGAATAGSHAMARTEGRAVLLAATALHQAGAALWLGGLPALLAALRRRPETAWAVGRRYSRFAAAGVALVLLGTLGFWRGYVGGVEALYGTAYGVLAATKAVLFGLLLGLGLGNFLMLHDLPDRFRPPGQEPLRSSDGSIAPSGPLRIRRFVEAELAIGLAMLALAVSLTSLPPASDLPEGRVAWAEVLERVTPAWPRLALPDLAVPAWPQAPAPGEAPPPRRAGDIAWGEHNHHWAGIMLLLAGFAAMLDATGRVGFARHWPLLLLGLAGVILLWGGPEAWPPGRIPLAGGLRDPALVRHGLAGLLVAGLALVEWAAGLGWVGSRARFAFPLAMLGGGGLLLAQPPAGDDAKEVLLLELSRLPLALLAVVGGIARWTELRGPESLARPARWIWPAALALLGLLLVLHREA